MRGVIVLKNELNVLISNALGLVSTWLENGLQGGNMVKVLNNSVLTVLFGTTGTRAHLYALVAPELCSCKMLFDCLSMYYVCLKRTSNGFMRNKYTF